MAKTYARRPLRWTLVLLVATGLAVAAMALTAAAGGTAAGNAAAGNAAAGNTTAGNTTAGDATAGGESVAPATITVYGTALRLSHDGFVDVDGNHRFSVGDELLIADVLRDGAHRRVGSDRGTCTIIHIVPGGDNAENSCVGTIALRGGTLTFQGIERTSTSAVQPAITGGTGRYEGAGGSAKVILRHGGDSSIWTIHLSS